MKTFIVNRNTHDLAENQSKQIKSMTERTPLIENKVDSEAAQHVKFTMGKIDHAHDAEDQGEPYGH